MGDERFRNLVVLNGHKQGTDSVSIYDIAQEFVSSDEKLRHFEQLQNVARVRRFI